MKRKYWTTIVMSCTMLATLAQTTPQQVIDFHSRMSSCSQHNPLIDVMTQRNSVTDNDSVADYWLCSSFTSKDSGYRNKPITIASLSAIDMTHDELSPFRLGKPKRITLLQAIGFILVGILDTRINADHPYFPDL